MGPYKQRSPNHVWYLENGTQIVVASGPQLPHISCTGNADTWLNGSGSQAAVELCRVFFKSLLNSPNREVAVAARLASRDRRSSIGKNLERIQQLTSLNPWLASKSQLQERLVQALAVAVPEADTWRPSLLQKLLGDRLEAHYNANEEEATELSRLISSLVSN